MKVRTEAIQFTADLKLVNFIEEKLGKLDRFFDRLIGKSGYEYISDSNMDQSHDDQGDNPVTAHLLVSVGHSVASLHSQSPDLGPASLLLSESPLPEHNP